MKRYIKFLIPALVLLSACQNEADVASYNLSEAADNFQIARRIVFTNTFTGEYLLSITGLCSIKSASRTTGEDGIAVTCKTGPGNFKKHYLGLDGHVTYFSEQLEPAAVGVYHYKVVFRPTAILPDVDLAQ